MRAKRGEAGERPPEEQPGSGAARDKRATVADVAARAGVSIGTVSNVLNGVIPVSDMTRQRVHQAIADLDYRQNMLAQGLRSKRAPIVGLCVPHTSITYFSELVDAFEEVASDNNMAIMQVLSRQDPRQEYERVRSLLNYRVGGLILVPTMTPETTFEMVMKSDIPTIVVDRAPDERFGFDKVTFDNTDAMRRAGQGLIQRGHRHVLFVVHQRQLGVTRQRIAGLEEALGSIAPKGRMQVVECPNQNALTAILAAELRRPERPTAIIVSNSKLASWLYRSLRALSVRCPEDVSVVAFDEPEWADIVTPSLSVVRQPTRDIAVMAWRFLLNRLSDRVTDPQSIELQAEVIFRDSVRAI
jgi:LacI family transcriptional regulator, galactose operon repressor